MDERGSDSNMDSRMYQDFWATEYVDINGDILVHTILVWIGSQ